MLEITGIWKTYGNRRMEEMVPAVKGVSLTVESGELFTLVGPSGCGKSTTLRCIAGLEQPDCGRIVVAGETLFERAHDEGARGINVPANKRGLGMVFQSYAIWPHLTVGQNVSFPLSVAKRSSRLSRKAIKERVFRALKAVHMEDFIDRQSTDLSGGQQQRIALARAVVTEPPLLLLDEPLSNLDAKLRESMRFEIRRLQRELGLTAVYVTHDQAEALSMSSRVAVMNRGSIVQVGTPQEIYEKPKSVFVADFIGASNFLQGTVVETLNAGSVLTVETALGRVTIDADNSDRPGDSVVLLVRCEAVKLVPLGSQVVVGDSYGSAGLVEASEYLGDRIEHTVRVKDALVRARGRAGSGISPGARVRLEVDPGAWIRLPAGEIAPDVKPPTIEGLQDQSCGALDE